MPYDYNKYYSAFFGTEDRNVPLSFGSLSRYTPSSQNNQIPFDLGEDDLSENPGFLSQLFKNQDGSYNFKI